MTQPQTSPPPTMVLSPLEILLEAERLLRSLAEEPGSTVTEFQDLGVLHDAGCRVADLSLGVLATLSAALGEAARSAPAASQQPLRRSVPPPSSPGEGV